MAEILVRDLTQEAVRRLKARAKQNGRSLQSEVKLILEAAAAYTAAEAKAALRRWQRSFKGRRLVDSVRLVRQDRSR